MQSKKIKLLTLCMVINKDRILLGMKKRGFGAGRWNGFGGKVNPDETIEQAALREIKEEIDIVPQNIDKRGVLTFEFENDPSIALEVHIFRVAKFAGTPIESEEMRPQWFTFDQIPYEQMWSDDVHWIPLFLAEKKFVGTFHFDKPSTVEYSAKIMSQQLDEVDSLPVQSMV